MDRNTRRSTGSLTVAAALTAGLLALTGCGQQTVDAGATTSPAPADTPNATEGADDAPTTQPTTEPAAPTSEPSDDEEADETADDDEPSAAADAAFDVENDPAWTAPGELVAVVGDLAVLRTEELPGPDNPAPAVALTAYRADGSTVWSRELEPPAELAGHEDLRPLVTAMHDTVTALWAGDPEGSDEGLVHVLHLDPATGEDRATGSLDVAAGVGISDRNAGDQFWLTSGPAGEFGGMELLTVGADGVLTSVEADPGSYESEVWWPVTSGRGVDLDDDGTITAFVDGERVGAGADCGTGDRSGADFPGAQFSSLLLSPDGERVLVPDALVDLGDGAVTCWSAARDDLSVSALADDGTVFGSVYSDEGDVGVFRQAGDAVVVDEDVTEQPVAVLGDVLLVSLDEGIAAHPFR